MRILLTGGSGCGKSTYAERLARSFSAPRYYIATMRPYDEECLAKICRHQQQREDGDFLTIERQTSVGAESEKGFYENHHQSRLFQHRA